MGGRDLQAVLDAVLSGVVVLGRDGRVELINDEASRILELSDAAATAMQSFLDDNPSDKHGTHLYSFGDVGMDEKQIRAMPETTSSSDCSIG